jgi:peptidoglycan L-alanyl-D-glutamate endopeptidase CwlK
MADKYSFGDKSKDRMFGVIPRLINTAERALSYNIMDMTVLDYGGVRNDETQKMLVGRGASSTLRSKHLIQDDGFGHALDLAPYPVDWKNIHRFTLMATLMYRAAPEEGLVLEWGGHWTNPADYCHFHVKRIL